MPVNPGDVIGATLTAQAVVNYYRFPLDASPIEGSALPGQVIGEVFSYLAPTEGRSAYYWMFEREDGSNFYVRHIPGTLDVDGIYVPPADPEPSIWDNLFGGIATGGLGLGKMALTGVGVWAFLKWFK